jgi:hypothetical protein
MYIYTHTDIRVYVFKLVKIKIYTCVICGQKSRTWGTARSAELFLRIVPEKKKFVNHQLLCKVVFKFAEKVLVRVLFETLLVLLNSGTQSMILWQIQSNSHGRHLLLDGSTLAPGRIIAVKTDIEVLTV